ncbi:MAG: six-hairpin glycosidase [Acidobacteria bacterium]|nr:MAG: six-hairpin glycosidase [Acidobacteriota bacterium]
MRTLLVVAGVLGIALAPAPPRETAGPAEYPIKAVALTDVQVTDAFWAPRIATNRTVTIPHIIAENEKTGRVDNFRKAARTLQGPYQGQRYNDTDVYKIIEAASWSLAKYPDPALDRTLDELIAIVAAAQEPDGYIYTPRTVDPATPAAGAGPERWSWLHTSHELYDQGHLYEAAVAYFQATGKRTLLQVAIKSADLVCRTFGPNGRRDVPGHEEIELALVKLARVTGDRKYLDEAKFFLDERGRRHGVEHPTFEPGSRFFMYNDLAYRQDETPVTAQLQAVGHAVRATYLYSAMTDAATLLDDPAYARAVRALFADVTSKRMYVTGGLGSEGRTEAFGPDYVLPNRAYAETCASVGGILWYHRLFLREGRADAIDTLERTLYNGYLSGVSLAGNTFFYQNPLVSNGTLQRSEYFDVACCPANLSRLMAQLPGLIYAQQPGIVYVNLFVGSSARVYEAGKVIRISQATNYPWQGEVHMTVRPERQMDFTLALRIPSWAQGRPVISDLYRYAAPRYAPPVLRVNGAVVPIALTDGYARVRRRWKKGDVVDLSLPMPVQRVLAHDGVAEDRGKAALQRGPIVYCLEAIDNGGSVSTIRLPLDAATAHAFRSDLLNGVETITLTTGDRTVVAIPYYAWNNRGKGEMAVWVPY